MKRLGQFVRQHPDLWLALGITLLAAALRFPALSQHPPGFYHDEAFNGLDALRIRAGERPVFFATNGGREAGFVYFVALAEGFLGRGPAAVRVVSSVMGTLIVPATFLLGRALYDRRVGALAAVVIAIMVVPIHLSHIGFRVVSVPFAIGWFLWAFVRAWRTGDIWRWGLAGLLYGLTFHTYTSSRITPFALLVMAVIVVLRGEWRRLWPGALWFGLGAALTFSPLGIYALSHPDIYFTRMAQTASAGGGLPGLLDHALRTAGMFFVRGDTFPRHNVPGRPFFDPLLGAAFLLGLILLWRDRKRTESVFVLVWLAVTSLTTMLSVNPPHFLRTTPMFPMLAVPPALGLAKAWEWAEARVGRRWQARVGVVTALAVSLFLSLAAYFSPRYRLAEDTYFQMDTSAVEMALLVNDFLGGGWGGEGWLADPALAHPQRQVLMPKGLWDFSETSRYLVSLEPDSSGPLTLIDGPEDVPDEVGEGVLLLLVPGSQWPYLPELPEGGVVEAWWGPTARADLETGEEPFVVYVAYRVMPTDGPPPAPEAEFAVGMALVGHEVEFEGDTVRVRTVWRAGEPIEEDYTLFVHLLSEGQVVGQADAPVGEGLYGTDWWRPDELVVQERVVPIESGADPATLAVNVGFYPVGGGERVALVGGGDFFTLPVE